MEMATSTMYQVRLVPKEKAEALARAEVETYRQHRAKVDADKVTK